MRRVRLIGAVAAAGLVLAGCGTTDTDKPTTTTSGGVTTVKLQLQPSSPGTSPPSTRASTRSRASTCS